MGKWLVVGGSVSQGAVFRWSVVLIKPVFSYRVKKSIDLKNLKVRKLFRGAFTL